MFQASRVVLIGSPSVGKTSILHRYLHGEAPSETVSTVGGLFYSYSWKANKKTHSVQFWDTAGQERYRSLGPIYYRLSQGAIAVFDLTRPETKSDLESWIGTFREHSGDPFVIIAANKCDVDGIDAKTDEVQAWAQALDAQCIWTSAVSGIGLADLFGAVLSHLTNTERRKVNAEEVGMSDEQEKSGCC
jgi:small GTP-binding protein